MTWLADNWDNIITVLNMIGLLLLGKTKASKVK